MVPVGMWLMAESISFAWQNSRIWSYNWRSAPNPCAKTTAGISSTSGVHDAFSNSCFTSGESQYSLVKTSRWGWIHPIMMHLDWCLWSFHSKGKVSPVICGDNGTSTLLRHQLAWLHSADALAAPAMACKLSTFVLLQTIQPKILSMAQSNNHAP